MDKLIFGMLTLIRELVDEMYIHGQFMSKERALKYMEKVNELALQMRNLEK